MQNNPQQWGVYGQATVATLGQMYGWSQAEVKQFSDPKHFDEMKNKVQKNVEETQDSIESLIESMLPEDMDLGDFDSFDKLIEQLQELATNGNAAAAGLIPFIRALNEVANLENGDIEFTAEEYSANEFNEQVASASDLGEISQARQDQKAIIDFDKKARIAP